MHDHNKLLEKMKAKGWTKEELMHANEIFSKNKTHHSIFHPKLDYVLHWFLFFIILIANLAVFFYMIPIIILIDGLIAYFLLAILGLGLGAIFDIVISDLTHLEKHHHVFMALLIPVITTILFMLSMYFIQQNYQVGNLFLHPLGLSLTYAIAVMIPYYLRILHK